MGGSGRESTAEVDEMMREMRGRNWEVEGNGGNVPGARRMGEKRKKERKKERKKKRANGVSEDTSRGY